jgi:hypothetical protein
MVSPSASSVFFPVSVVEGSPSRARTSAEETFIPKHNQLRERAPRASHLSEGLPLELAFGMSQLLYN